MKEGCLWKMHIREREREREREMGIVLHVFAQILPLSLSLHPPPTTQALADMPNFGFPIAMAVGGLVLFIFTCVYMSYCVKPEKRSDPSKIPAQAWTTGTSF
jgi:hypothetical protein